MSMEAYALCDRPLRSIEEWQGSVVSLGFDMSLTSKRNLSLTRGYLPALWRGREAGFECGTIPLSDLVKTYDDLGIDFGGPWACIYACYFHTLPSCAGTWIAVAACLSATGGMAFDAHDGLLMSAKRALDYARKTIADVDDLEAHLPN